MHTEWESKVDAGQRKQVNIATRINDGGTQRWIFVWTSFWKVNNSFYKCFRKRN